MPARVRSPEQICSDLRSMEADQRLQAIRDVKNQIIGNRTKKLAYIKLGAVPLMVENLACEGESNLLVQAAAAIGSFACGIDEGVRAVLDSGAVSHLLKTLWSEDAKVVEAGARSLKLIFQSPLAPKGALFEDGAPELMARLLAGPDESVAEVAASVLARCCETKEQQQRISSLGVFPGLLRLLSSPSPKGQEAALDALAALTRNNEALSTALLGSERAADRILVLARDKEPRRRILACMCLANISRTGALSDDRRQEISALVLPTVVKLLGEGDGVGEEAPRVLAHLIVDSEELQAAACDADAIGKLTCFLRGDGVRPRLRESTLLALSALCSSREESRRQLVDSGVVEAMGHADAGVRAAACLCAKSLSRSVKNLRTSLVQTPVVEPLLRLLADSDSAVQASASATLCNIVLEFSPMKDLVLRAGGVQKLVALAQSPDPALRLNAMWALRNMLYHADGSVKARVLGEMTWPLLQALLRDPEVGIQEQALNLLRNLAHGPADDVDRVLRLPGGAAPEVAGREANPLLVAVAGKVPARDGGSEEVRLHALYVLCNVACGGEAHKEAVMAAGVPALLPIAMADPTSAEVRVAAVWVVINLTYRGKGVPGEGVAERARRLREHGVESQLEAMVGDACVNVKDRVKTALEQLRSAAAP